MSLHRSAGNIGYPRSHKIIPGLMAWLQDMNWPGAEIVMEILESIDRKTLIPYIEDSLEKAADDDDLLWITAIRERKPRRLGILRGKTDNDHEENKG